jgi:hypothetical protein
LRLFGEHRRGALLVAEKDKAEAQSLFPEAVVGSP